MEMEHVDISVFFGFGSSQLRSTYKKKYLNGGSWIENLAAGLCCWPEGARTRLRSTYKTYADLSTDRHSGHKSQELRCKRRGRQVYRIVTVNIWLGKYSLSVSESSIARLAIIPTVLISV